MKATPKKVRTGALPAALAISLAALLCLPLSASAQGEAAPDSASATLSASLALARIEEDLHLRLALSAWVSTPSVALTPPGLRFSDPQPSPFHFRFYAPFHFLVRDGGAEESDRFRKRDWDEPGDFLRTLRSLRWGSPQGHLFLQGGELSGLRIGHRTLVDSYINALNIDQFRWGLFAELNAERGGAELLLDSVSDPGLLGGRLWLRPLAFAHENPALERLATGASAFVDISAPLRLAVDDEGLYQVDDQRRLVVEERDTAPLLGFDLEYALVQRARISLTPYSDLNFMPGRGSGWHVGSFFGAQASEALHFDLRGEYRRMGAGYLPVYFGPLYEIERYAFLPRANPEGIDPTQRLPKLQWLRSGEGRVRSGWLVEAGVDWSRRLRMSFALEDAQGPGQAALRLRAAAQNIGPVEFAFWYVRTAFDIDEGLFSLDDALLISEARVSLNPWLFLTGQLNRRWLVGAEGTYDPVDDFAVGVGAAISF